MAISVSHTVLIKLDEMAEANMGMNPLHFGNDTADTQMHISPKILI